MIKTPAAAKKYRQPKYPSRMEVLADPELLRKHVPRAWKACGEITASLAVFLAAAGSAQAQERSEQTQSPAVPAQTTTTTEVQQNENEVHRKIFRFCTLIPGGVGDASEPVSEETILTETSLKVVETALRNSKAKLKLKHQEDMLGKEPLRAWFELNGKQETRKIKVSGDINFLIPDAVDSKKKIAIKIVDFTNDDFLAGLSKIEPKPTDEVTEGAPIYIGFFEDTMRCKVTKKERAEAKRMLRQQVADFVAWLKAQGVI